MTLHLITSTGHLVSTVKLSPKKVHQLQKSGVVLTPERAGHGRTDYLIRNNSTTRRLLGLETKVALTKK